MTKNHVVNLEELNKQKRETNNARRIKTSALALFEPDSVRHELLQY